MVHASVFSGIGGPEVAAAMLGWDNAFHCEINPFGRKVLEYWFPKSESYEDITKTDFTKWHGKIDVLTGGFPCQPFSYAGKRGGGKKTTVTSGRKCCELLTKSGPLGSLVKMLLESPLWWKEAHSLKWDMKPLFSEKVIDFTAMSSDRPTPSSASAKILRDMDIPSSRCLFRLRVSARRTGERESSLSLMLMTPTVVNICETPESMLARKKRKGYKNGTKYNSLESQLKYDPNLSWMLPTPSARDWKGKTTPGVRKKGGQIYGETLPDAHGRLTKDCFLKTDGEDFQLSPLFLEEMMGFPLGWTTYPFLEQSGG